MTDFFFQMGLSNACLSLALAIVAMVAGAKARRPQLAHMLWLLVFVKLVTPPIVKIPIVTIPAQGETDGAISDFTKAIKKRPMYGMAFYYRAMVNSRKKEYDQAIADYTKAIEIDEQRFAVAYAERALNYYIMKEYDKAWEDVHKAQSLGQEVRFLEILRKDSGRKK